MISEVIYLVLFFIFTNSGFKGNIAVLLAGSICILMTSFLHARITFKTRFDLQFLLSYLVIQFICMLASFIIGSQLVALNASDSLIGFVTMISWAFISYALCKVYFKRAL